MIRNRADEELACRKVNSGGDGKPAAAGSSRPWSAQAESRIVRVSRVFGGKDRHSKVRTVKGLRDRRVRLSVPTAIQLYDLQDRLGLNQPSKVVDWLLNAAQHEIDKLPPLQFPPQDLLGHLPSPMPASDIATAVTSASATAKCDGVCNDGEEAHLGLFPASAYRIMSLNNSLGLVNGAMPLGHHGSYCPGESWNNSSNNSAHEANCSPPVVAHHHSSFPSLLSLAPGSQLVFYSSDGGQFPVDNVNSQSLSLSSARTFHQSGSHG